MDNPTRRSFERIDDLLVRQDTMLRRLLVLMRTSLTLEIAMSQELDALTAEVAKTKTIIDSAIVLINGIAARIAAAGADPAKLAALTADLDGGAEALAAAVTANTPPTT